MTHYSELLEPKGLVLVRGDIIHPQLVSRFEVRLCMLCTLRRPAGPAWVCRCAL